MKKNKLLLSLFIICLLTGCGESKKKQLDTNLSQSIKIENESEAALICTMDYDYSDLNYVLGSKYVVFGKDNKIEKIESKEIISSYEKEKLDQFEDYYNKNHNAASNYNGYEYDLKRTDDSITSTVIIDYKEFDLNKFLSDNDIKDSEKDYTIDGVEKKYISLGAECKKNDN